MIMAFRTPNYWMVLISTVPQVILFLSVVEAFDRPDLITNALMAPILMNMWSTALWTGGSVMRDDRWGGLLEIHAASPQPYGLVVSARVAAVVLLSLLVIPVTLVTAGLTYGVDVQVNHWVLLMTTMLVTAFAVVGTGIVFSSMTILSRAAITFQGAASYPFLLLGGVFVPLELLPEWVHPFGRFIFLSWSSDLVRDSVTQPPVDNLLPRLGMVVLLGGLGFIAGLWLVRVVLDKVRMSGEISTI
jgi:ABC-2 type transport system permease protein